MPDDFSPSFVTSQEGITDRFLNEIPAHTGVYIMKDEHGSVLYVGKARSLRDRVRQYFKRSGDTRYSVRFIRRYVKNIEFCLTDTEKEALLLENNLIKKLKPRYNIRLRDDKTFLHIRIDMNHDFPMLNLIRRPKNDGALYLGPYSSSRELKEMIRHLQYLYPLRLCKDSVFRTRTRPCLNCQIRKCLGPCCGGISKEDYRVMLDEVIMILRGQKQEVVQRLKTAMEEASANMEFERAAQLRDRIYALEQSTERQDVVTNTRINKDYFGVHFHDKLVAIHALSVRDGRLEGSDNFIFAHNELPYDELFQSFLEQFYANRPAPEIIVVRTLPDARDALAEWLSDKTGRKVTVTTAERGENIRLLNMAERNAQQNLAAQHDKDNDLQMLKRKFHLTHLPRIMECYDISNFQGEASVASQVVFENCQPKKSKYRKYTIKTVTGQNDFAMMAEVISRRLERAIKEENFPQLIIIDGGRGQLSAAYRCYEERAGQLPHIDFIALAKDRDSAPTEAMEKVFLPGRKNPIMLKSGSHVAKIIDRIRDEAHRFAITFNRKTIKQRRLKSDITSIPGLGKSREKLLRIYFGSLKRLKSASLEQLLLVDGIGPKLAETIYYHFHSRNT